MGQVIRINEEALAKAAPTISRTRYLSHAVSDEELMRQAVNAYEEAHPRPRRAGPQRGPRPDVPTRIAPTA